VGGALFEPALLSLRLGGRHMVIVSKGTRRVTFNLTDFYHNRSRLLGVDSLGLSGPEIASIMDQLRPGFEAGALRPFDVTPWELTHGADAYAAADRDGANAKHILLPA
jgi:NADPH:quinone reductase